LKLAPAQGVHLLMPRLGEAIEPSQVERVQPWWRDVETAPAAHKPGVADETPETISPSVGFPID
jgi:hypothetical protein